MRSIRSSILALSLVSLLFTSCKKDCDMHPIVVNAGNDQTVQLPTDTTSLTGTVTSGLTANTTYLWTLISGPSAPVFANNNAAVTSIGNLVAGTYLFQFQATNSYGMTGLDTTSIVVLPVAGPKSVTLQPNDNAYEGDINLYAPTQWITDDQIYAEAWTDGGAPFVARACLKFDYSSIPNNAVISSAALYLYSDPNPINGDKVNSQQGPTDACYIQRITSNWVLPTPFTWNSPPTTVTTNEATIPQSTSSTENVVVDVTSLVKDMQVNGNNGFFIVLQNEVTYNTRQFASSFTTDTTIHPKLVVTYQ